jgi:hypothetical protein
MRVEKMACNLLLGCSGQGVRAEWGLYHAWDSFEMHGEFYSEILKGREQLRSRYRNEEDNIKIDI